MPKKIKFNLSSGSIQKALEDIKTWKEEIEAKNLVFVQRLAEAGIPVVDERIAEVEGDSDKSHSTYIRISSEGLRSSATLVLEGEDVAFLEFGAGVHYNTQAGTSPHPKGQELGMTIGSYGLGQGQYDYWFYKDENGQTQKSYGTRAGMPLYYASQEIINKVREIANEVFA